MRTAADMAKEEVFVVPCVFETYSHFVAWAGFNLMILLSAGVTDVYHPTWSLCRVLAETTLAL